MKSSNLKRHFLSIFGLASCLVSAAAPSLAMAGLVDMWVAKNLNISESFVTTADGTRIPVPKDKELLVQLRLQTIESYGSGSSRQVKSKTVKDGVISLELETASEKACNRDEGFGIAMMAPHSVDVQMGLAPSTYQVKVNGDLVGTLNVAEKGAFDPNPNAVADYNARSAAEFEKIAGDLATISIAGDKSCKVQIQPQGDDGIIKYEFPSYQETLRNGDILIKKERKGDIALASYDVRIDCDKDRKELSYRVTLNGPKREGSITFTVAANKPGERKNLRFSTDDVSCSHR